MFMKNKILIVDDKSEFRRLTKTILSSKYEVETAENGRLGLALAEDMKPDIILLDLMMPEMNGDEMLQKMRATGWGKDIKVIVLTNIGEQEIPDSLKSLGVLAVIAKADMTPRQVAELVKKHLVTA